MKTYNLIGTLNVVAASFVLTSGIGWHVMANNYEKNTPKIESIQGYFHDYFKSNKFLRDSNYTAAGMLGLVAVLNFACARKEETYTTNTTS